jgi:branched-chain amino acid transport system substrate-binding protein
MKRNSILKFLFTTLLTAVLTAACGLFSSTDTPQTPTSTKSPVTSAEVVKIGAILPLTGPTAYLGEGEKFGMELALKNRTQTTPKIEILFEDSQGKPDVAVSSARKLLDIQNVDIHVVATTAMALAALPVYEKSGKDVLVFPQSVMPGITKKYPFAYRVYATADEETDLLAAYAKKQGYKRVGALNVFGKLGEEAIKQFQSKISVFDGQVVATESFPLTEKDFRVALQKFKNLNLDAILLYPPATVYPTIAKQIDEVGLDLPILGSLNLAFKGLDKKLTPKFIEKTVFPAPRYFVASDDPKVKEFDEKTKASGKESSFDIAYFYDMTNILIKAIESTPSRSAKAIGETIMKNSPYDGVTGKIRLNQDRDTKADMDLVRWGANGTIEVVAKSS